MWGVNSVELRHAWSSVLGWMWSEWLSDGGLVDDISADVGSGGWSWADWIKMMDFSLSIRLTSQRLSSVLEPDLDCLLCHVDLLCNLNPSGSVWCGTDLKLLVQNSKFPWGGSSSLATCELCVVNRRLLGWISRWRVGDEGVRSLLNQW